MTAGNRRRAYTTITLTAAAAAAAAWLSPTAAHAAPAPTPAIRGADNPAAIDGQYIVVLKDSPTAAASATATAKTTKAGKQRGNVRHSYTAALKGYTTQLTEAGAKALAADPTVDYIEQDHRVAVNATQTGPTWGLDRIDQASLPLSRTYTAGPATGVTAYILDTGVRLSHTQFAGRATSGYDFIDNDADASDCHGHGTHVAGTVAGSTYGVAKNASIVAVRVLDCKSAGSYSAIIGGVDWVTAHAVKPAVANMSLGGTTSDALDQAVRRSISSGITYAVAAGNDKKDACGQSPARAAEAITVGATTSTDARAVYSNFGTCLDLFAPGSDILSSSNAGNATTTTMSGTSMATPHVTGAVALYLAGHPTATPAQVRSALLAAATAGKVTGAGTGSPNRLLNITTLTGTTTTPPVKTPPTATACAPITNATAQKIADRATVTSKITPTCTGKASATSKVAVNIAHTDRGDLALWLTAPDGTQYKLKSSTSGDNNAGLVTTYTANLAAETRTGAWTLTVKDVFTGDTGTLKSWTLTL